MPIITTLVKANTTGQKVKGVQDELLSIGLPIDPTERTQSRFGPSTSAAVLDFKQRFGLPTNNSDVDAPTGAIMVMASTFAVEDDRAKVREVVRDVVRNAATTPEVAYHAARYAIIMGDYKTADEAAAKFPAFDRIKEVVRPVIELPTPIPRPPEVPYPENFYSYQRPLIDPAKVEKVALELASSPNLPAGTTSKQKSSAEYALAALRHWNDGNQSFERRRYATAVDHYNACQDAIADYFRTFYGFILSTAGQRNSRMVRLIANLSTQEQTFFYLWSRFRIRRELLSLDELNSHDRFGSSDAAFSTAALFLDRFTETDDKQRREEFLDTPLITLAFVLAPLARAEANRQRRQFDAAISDLNWVLKPYFVQQPGDVIDPGDVFTNAVMFAPMPTASPLPPISIRRRYRVACEFIELPFARLLLAETLLDKADAQYKARIPADPQDFPEAPEFQNLQAAKTYQQVFTLFEDEGEYITRVLAGRDQIAMQIQERLAAGDTSSHAFQILGKEVPIPTITSISETLPGLDLRNGPHERLLLYTAPDGQSVLLETNPRVYAVLIEAQARLEQIKAGFNYLGYKDDYIPPWRFQFLLERTRYFAEHARNAQREYLNFLSNAEREEFQELSAAQNVILEKSNVRIETARVDQTRFEMKAAEESAELANLISQNSQKRLDAYDEFKDYTDRLFDVEGQAFLFYNSIYGYIEDIPGVNAIAAGVGDFFGFGAVSNIKQTLSAAAQREVEKYNLQLAVEESNKSAQVAQAQLRTVQAGLVVANLQRSAALLRHEFAVQNLTFLRNRTLNAEQWYRLAGAIRGISETYLRYAVELAFLAEQAYEFEADKRINVISFDYDASELGDFLAADFLLSDLDTLEQDLIVNQPQRQQQVRYVLSLAREAPQALQELRETGLTTFSFRLEQLERRFPGLYNLRMGAVDVLPIALMDSTRFSLKLTYLGSSQVRLRAQPDTPPGIPSPSPLNQNDLPVSADGWLSELQDTWPVKIRINGPDTAVFSGLTRQDATSIFPYASSGQRNAFEGLGAAAAWQVDMSIKENQVVPGTLADLIITFTLSGYYDVELNRAVDLAPRRGKTLTQWLSARQSFPDAYYEFNRSGRMSWPVTDAFLTLNDSLGVLRNAGLILLPSAKQVQFGRLTANYRVNIRITAAGGLEVLSEIPQVGFQQGAVSDNPLTVVTQTVVPAGATVAWDFGDGTGFQNGSTLQHTYTKAGRYDVTLRVVRNGRLTEYKAALVVSRQHTVAPPLAVFPALRRLNAAPDTPPGHTRIRASMNEPAGETLTGIWKIDKQPARTGNTVNFDLLPGDYTLLFTAMRSLQARVYCRQRFVPDQSFTMSSLRLNTNRNFDSDGNQTNAVSLNALSRHLFTRGALSPVDNWVLELPLADNLCLRSVSPADTEQFDFSEMQDAVLSLEYETSA